MNAALAIRALHSGAEFGQRLWYTEYHSAQERKYEYMFLNCDAGRSRSARPKSKNDCTVRAIAAGLNIQFDKAYGLMAEHGRKPHRGVHFKEILIKIAKVEWTPFPAVRGERRMTRGKVSLELPHGVYFLRCARHVVAMIDGVQVDLMPDPEACVYGAWRLISPSSSTPTKPHP